MLCGTTEEEGEGQSQGPSLPPYIATTGNFRALVAYVRFADDTRPWTTCGPNDWPLGDSMPAVGARLLDPTPTGPFDPESLTSYFLEQSSGHFRVFGDEFGVVVRNEGDYLAPGTYNYNLNSPNLPNLTTDIFNYLVDSLGVNLAQYDADGNGRLDHVFVVIRSTGRDSLNNGYGFANCPSACASGVSSIGNPGTRNYGVVVNSEHSGSYNRFSSVEPLRDNVLLLAHEMGHDIWGNNHYNPVVGNATPFLSPPGLPSAGDRFVAHSLMVSRGGSAGRLWENHMTAASERAYVASTIADPAQRWITCPAALDGQTYTLGDVQATGACVSVPVGGVGTNVRELYLSNMQRVSVFNEMRYPLVNPGGVVCNECRAVEWGTPTAGLVVEYVSRTAGSNAQWNRDIVPADERLTDFGTFPGCSLYLDTDPTAEDLAGGDFWRPGVDRQLTPWTHPNVYGHHDLTTVSADVLATGLHAIDDIRAETGGAITFDYFQNYTSRPVAVVREDWWITSHTNGLASFNEVRVPSGSTLYIEPSAVATFYGALVIEDGGRLDADEAILRFGPDASLVVEAGAEMSANEATFAAVNPTVGWRGVRLGKGNPIVWTNVTVQDVTLDYVFEPTEPSAAVVAYRRPLTIQGGFIQRTRYGYGLYASNGPLVVNGGARIQDNGLGGVAVGAGTVASFSGEALIIDNLGGGLEVVGTGAVANLFDVVIDGNIGSWGVLAEYGGRVSTYFAADAVSVSNNNGGLAAQWGGDVTVGYCKGGCGHQPYQIADNRTGGQDDARALGGSVVYAQGNQWGTTVFSESDLNLEADGTSFLSVTPVVPPSGTPRPDGLAGTVASGGLGRGIAAAPLYALASQLIAEGDTLGAQDAVLGALDAATDGDDRQAVYQAAGRLAAVAHLPALVARVAADAAEQTGEPQAWARRALLAARESADDWAGARTLAGELLAAYPGTEHATEAHASLVRVAVRAEEEAEALAAYDALRAAAPSHGLTRASAALVASAFDVDVPLARGAGSSATEASAVSASRSTTTGEIEVGAVVPNPTAGRATIPLYLPEAASVNVQVVDALGRVVVQTSGEHAAGGAALDLDVGRLAPGLYVARVVVGQGAGARAETRRFVVAR